MFKCDPKGEWFTIAAGGKIITRDATDTMITTDIESGERKDLFNFFRKWLYRSDLVGICRRQGVYDGKNRRNR